MLTTSGVNHGHKLFFVDNKSVGFLCFHHINYYLYKNNKNFEEKKIIINGIWFSEDGSFSEDAQYNLIQLGNKIKNSPYKNVYQIFLWTDKKKLNKKSKKSLCHAGVVIKDYRNNKATDQPSKMMTKWINDLLELGDQSNKYFYTRVSDLLRFYLLFKIFPQQYHNEVTIYFDCNDVEIFNIPHPDIFKRFNAVAFNFGYIQYNDFLLKLIGSNKGPLPYLNSDVLISVNKNNSYLNEIFEMYYNNLIDVDKRAHGFIAKLTETKKSIKWQDKELAFSIAFAISQTSIVLRLTESSDLSFMVKWDKEPLEIKGVDWIQPSSDFLEFERNDEKGLTWASSSIGTIENNSENPYRKFWYDLFATRYHLISKLIY